MAMKRNTKRSFGGGGGGNMAPRTNLVFKVADFDEDVDMSGKTVTVKGQIATDALVGQDPSLGKGAEIEIQLSKRADAVKKYLTGDTVAKHSGKNTYFVAESGYMKDGVFVADYMQLVGKDSKKTPHVIESDAFIRVDEPKAIENAKGKTKHRQAVRIYDTKRSSSMAAEDLFATLESAIGELNAELETFDDKIAKADDAKSDALNERKKDIETFVGEVTEREFECSLDVLKALHETNARLTDYKEFSSTTPTLMMRGIGMDDDGGIAKDENGREDIFSLTIYGGRTEDGGEWRDLTFEEMIERKLNGLLEEENADATISYDDLRNAESIEELFKVFKHEVDEEGFTVFENRQVGNFAMFMDYVTDGSNAKFDPEVGLMEMMPIRTANVGSDTAENKGARFAEPFNLKSTYEKKNGETGVNVRGIVGKGDLGFLYYEPEDAPEAGFYTLKFASAQTPKTDFQDKKPVRTRIGNEVYFPPTLPTRTTEESFPKIHEQLIEAAKNRANAMDPDSKKDNDKSNEQDQEQDADKQHEAEAGPAPAAP